MAPIHPPSTSFVFLDVFRAPPGAALRRWRPPSRQQLRCLLGATVSAPVPTLMRGGHWPSAARSRGWRPPVGWNRPGSEVWGNQRWKGEVGGWRLARHLGLGHEVPQHEFLGGRAERIDSDESLPGSCLVIGCVAETSRLAGPSPPRGDLDTHHWENARIL